MIILLEEDNEILKKVITIKNVFLKGKLFKYITISDENLRQIFR